MADCLTMAAERAYLKRVLEGEPRLTAEICERDYARRKQSLFIYSTCGACFAVDKSGAVRAFGAASTDAPPVLSTGVSEKTRSALFEQLARAALAKYTEQHEAPDLLLIHHPRGKFRTLIRPTELNLRAKQR